MEDKNDNRNAPLHHVAEVVLTFFKSSDQGGQLPYIARLQAEVALRRPLGWDEMQQAYDLLVRERKVFPQQNFRETIIKRGYKI